MSYAVLQRIREQSAHGPKFTPGYCALAVRTMFHAPSSGDADHDNQSDAEDIWAKCPKDARHRISVEALRNGLILPRCVPIVWGSGSHDNGHVGVTTGYGQGVNGRLWSTDIERVGFFDITTVGECTAWLNSGAGPDAQLLGWVEYLGGVRVVPKGGW